MRSLERIVTFAKMFVRLSVRLSVLDGHALLSYVGVDLNFNVLGTLTAKHVHLLPTVFFQFHLEERCGLAVQTRRGINADNDK